MGVCHARVAAERPRRRAHDARYVRVHFPIPPLTVFSDMCARTREQRSTRYDQSHPYAAVQVAVAVVEAQSAAAAVQHRAVCSSRRGTC